jgi:hypothetical protein
MEMRCASHEGKMPIVGETLSFTSIILEKKIVLTNQSIRDNMEEVM